MIRHLIRQDIDDAKWNECIKKDNQHLPYALVEYLDVVAPNWQALVLNDYETVMPLPIRKKYFISYLFRPQYTPQLGIFSQLNKPLSRDELLQFYRAIPKQIQLIDFEVHNKMPTDENFGKFSEKANYLLKLNQPYEALRKNYKYNTRQAIKKALEKNSTVKEKINTEHILELLDRSGVNNAANFTEADIKLTHQLIQTLYKNDIGFSFGIYNDSEQLEALIFYVKFNDRIINLINASTQLAKQNKWMMLLIDHLIKANADSNFMIDFEGSSIESIARFFKSFGAENKPYYHWHWNRLPAVINWFRDK